MSMVPSALPPCTPLVAGLSLACVCVWGFTKAYANVGLLLRPQPPRTAFHGKRVWIIGASQGIGRALALYYAHMGAQIILTSRSMKALQDLREELQSVTSRIEIVPLDITAEPKDLETAVQVALSHFKGVDYVVHAVGASQHAAVEETSYSVASTLLQINLGAPIALCRAMLPRLSGQHCHHIVVSSMAAVVPSPGQAVYSAAKAGLSAYFQTLSTELSDRRMTVTVCCPGPLSSSTSRTVYGPTGPKTVQGDSAGNRLDVDLVAQLIAKAGYYKLDHVWISHHPVLLMAYLMFYIPWLGMMILKKIGPKRVKLLRQGRGYNVRAMIGQE